MTSFAKNNQPIEQNSFFSVYVSLILIILTFVLAFFFRPDAFVAQTQLNWNENSISEELVIDNPFTTGDSSLNLENWSGVIFTLQNHDVDAEIRVEAASDEDALAKGVRIFRGLLEKGIPASAVRVYGVGAKSNKVLVKFYDLQK